ncbi:MAG: FecR domain-containing protein, partial [Bacteroidota bacterium]
MPTSPPSKDWRDLVEDDTFRDWLARTPEHDPVYPGGASPAEVRKARAFLSDHRFLTETVATPPRRVKRAYQRTLATRRERGPHRPRWVGIAAAVLLLLATGGWWAWHNTEDELPWLEYAGSPTEFAAISLPDGTEVRLGHDARLRLRHWTTTQTTRREVWLEGEAYFQVRKARTPSENFVVHSGELAVEVLGTAFNVNTHRKDTRVVLEEGSIGVTLARRLGKGDAPILLVPGERLDHAAGSGTVRKTRVDPHHYTSWKDGELVFEHQPLREVARRLEEIFGVRVELSPASLGEEKIRMTTSSEDL